EPNELEMRYERIPKQNLDRYRVVRKRHYIYRAAARLWQEGVAWGKALEIVTEAFDGACHEA
ncbi:unnamed protein product, partial [Durusdinium trenchii]